MKARWILLAVCVGLATLLAFPVAHAGDDDDDGESLVGTWRFTVSSPFGGGFLALITFHADNTLIDRSSVGPFFSVGVGVWEAIGDDDDDDSDSDSDQSDFAVTFEGFEDIDFDHNFDTRFRARSTLFLENDTLTGTATIEIRTLDNSQLIAGPFPGFTVEATRMTVIPE